VNSFVVVSAQSSHSVIPAKVLRSCHSRESGNPVSLLCSPNEAVSQVSSASAAAEFLLFARAKRSSPEKARPTLAPDFVRCPALLAGLGPVRTRASMRSDMRAFPPSATPLLGARDGREIKRQSQGPQLAARCVWRARRAPLLGPLGCGEAGTISPKGRGHEARAFSVSTGTCCRKPRPRLTYLEGRMPGRRDRGVPFSLVTFSWARKRK
jgi:hypothetical protein